ncbi:hypothetical protein P175DRAFT_0433350 [Aspergillus ochraceoroseus IBT 24754]|uniref:Amino acid permease/ SLC12A domain-containing protein n=1 Tax=Aspergillus ochraceoroseus IBT 24754 TaxID=1392256 RepID=A0A2T5M3Y7_9EURO|nr:uncharacterized protein P175DRAFT_0433350 [Aspergillus ochraceoroseus IBT 24754]PTU23253.1 hypothetical protein P175DRAFT_0433350 [Aspergillus ochraceoroseus IBT 24754]
MEQIELQSTDPESRGTGSKNDRDRLGLARLGKKSVLQRSFGILSILGFSCTILATWEGLFAGGSAGAIYSYILAWIGTFCTFVVIAELASMAPTSGGQYHWCAMLAPPHMMKFLSYITGWVTVIGWQAGFASAAYLAGTEIQGAAILAYSNYTPHAWQGTLILWAAVVLALGINLGGGGFLSRLETVVLVVHILGFFGILIPLTYMGRHRSSSEVFQEFLNGGNLPTQGVSWFVGMMGSVFAFAGGDAAVHMAEEVQNASVAVPRAILLSILINGTLGFSMLIAVLFCMGDIETALATPTGYPYMEIFHQITGSVSGALGMSSVVLIIGVTSVIGMLAATSRQLWAFARDRGVPGWRIWSHVSTSRALPTNSIYLTMAICCLLGLINIGSSVALNDVVSMTVSGLYTSYLIVVALLFYRRTTGQISRIPQGDSMVANVPGAELVWGPFHVPGIWGAMVNACALIYILIIIFFSFWPTQLPVTAENMNYSVVGTWGTIFLAVLYYAVRARKVYTGPVREIAIPLP